MPICAQCRVAYTDGESHRCEPKRRRGWTLLAVIVFVYAVLAVAMGKPLLPLVAISWMLKALLVRVGVLSLFVVLDLRTG
jgi:hypothetical protein